VWALRHRQSQIWGPPSQKKFAANGLGAKYRHPSSDRRETLPNDVNQVELYKLGPKTGPNIGPKIGVPKKIFLGKAKFNIWLKIQRMRAYNFGVRGSNLTKLFHVTCREAGIIIWVQLFGGSAPPPEKLEGKPVQNYARFWTTSDFDCEYLRNGYKCRKIRKASDQLLSLPRSRKKCW